MPISAIGNSETGFSLVELMVVIAIIGLLSAVVVLRLPSGGGAPLAEAQRLSAALNAARTEAVVSARAIRVTFGEGAPIAEQRRRGRWQPLPPAAIGLRNWPREIAAAPAQLLFDPTGVVSGADQVTLARGTETARILVSAEGDIRVAR